MEFVPHHLPGLGMVYGVRLVEGRARDLVKSSLLASTLKKRSGALVKSWESRFCVLLPTQLLLYFESSEDTQPKGMVALHADTAVAPLEGDASIQQFYHKED